MKPDAEQQRGLLRPEQFDLDDNDATEPEIGNEAYTRSRSSRAPTRWSRRRYLIWGLVALAGLLIVGTALNKGAGIKIPKLYKTPSPPEEPQDPQDTKTDFDGPVHPKPPLNAESSVSSNPSTSPPSSTPSTSSVGPLHVSTSYISEGSATSSPTANSSVDAWDKPSDFKIIGLIFFGRPPVVTVLDCYLKRNLVTNGGWLDEVQFVVNTNNEDDIGWLDTLVDEEKLYKKVTKPEIGYNHIWELVEREHMYIKIDDDIVFFTDNAIPDIVWSKLHHTDSLNVVASLINSPETGWLHYRLGAIHSYLPELKKPTDADPEALGPKAWRASKLPVWNEKEMDWPIAGVRAGKDDTGETLPPDVPGAPPFKGHRWLPLPENERNLDKTPMIESSYDPDGPDWGSWSLGAQAHYSFLENLEKGELSRYYYGWGLDPDREAIWHMMYQRMNINFMAIWGKDVLDNLPFETFDDELALSVTVPKKLRRPLLINTKAIAAHFAFRSQLEMHDTDLLDRYRAYANENICTKDNQIPYHKYTT